MHQVQIKTALMKRMKGTYLFTRLESSQGAKLPLARLLSAVSKDFRETSVSRKLQRAHQGNQNFRRAGQDLFNPILVKLCTFKHSYVSTLINVSTIGSSDL
ncbi:hypothetical protein RND81_14G228400 [Saponaria officinalis]|uniref:Uncharacterized protein n=1 Tax=Saponaria officinalis TaxID=3572 RepID=A0AAW1GVE0_SAPOF